MAVPPDPTLARVLVVGAQSGAARDWVETLSTGSARPRYAVSVAADGDAAVDILRASLDDGRPFQAIAFVQQQLGVSDLLVAVRNAWAVDGWIQSAIVMRDSRRQRSDVEPLIGDSERLLIMGDDASSLQIQAAARVLVAKWQSERHRDEGYVAAAQELRELRSQVSRMHGGTEPTRVDRATGLPMRDAFVAALASRGARKGHFGVAVIDIDGFRNYADALGGPASDEIITVISGRIANWADSGDMIARGGADVFLVRLEKAASEDDFVARIRELQGLLQREISVASGRPVKLSSSAGVHFIDSGKVAAHEALAGAEAALHRAKAYNRGGCVAFQRSMAKESARRLELEAGLRGALADDALELYYQPLVSLGDGRLLGFEALLRWTHEGKPVSPVEFIPIAEESKLILDIGRWVTRTACAQARRFNDAAQMPLYVSFNVSPVQVAESDLLADFRSALRDSGAEASMMKLEVTESVVMKDRDRAVRLLEGLRSEGAAVYIDDFGTGYSSLAQLSALPVDALKIDRAFVRDMDSKPQDEAIARTVVALGHTLGLLVIAEGVETEKHVACLAEMGCDIAQGYLFAKPMPAADAMALVRSGPVLLPKAA